MCRRGGFDAVAVSTLIAVEVGVDAAAVARNVVTARLGVPIVDRRDGGGEPIVERREGDGEIGETNEGAVLAVPFFIGPLFFGEGKGVFPREEGELSLEDMVVFLLCNNIYTYMIISPRFVFNEHLSSN